MEKDQLAQLLDEKDLLQKVQDEKIQNLKRMLVTSSSIALQQELKVELQDGREHDRSFHVLKMAENTTGLSKSLRCNPLSFDMGP